MTTGDSRPKSEKHSEAVEAAAEAARKAVKEARRATKLLRRFMQQAEERRSPREVQKAKEKRQQAQKRAARTQAEKEARAKKLQPSDYEEMSLEETLEQLATDPQEGLSQSEAQRRLQKYGPNAIKEEKEHPIKRFFSYFWGPIPWMIEAAVIIAGAVQHWTDFGVIFFLLLINGLVSWWHEKKASDAIQALKEKLAPEARVIREGEQKTIDARNLVSGDVVMLEMGDVVPADAKLLHDQSLMIDESSLTGESLPVEKNEGDQMFSSTTVNQGEGRAVVIATGACTKFARTVELVQSAGVVSHFQKAVLRIGYFVIALTGILVAAIVGFSLYRSDPWMNVLLFALVVTIAGIPVALPAVLTVTMAVGASMLARMKAIVTHLASMEEMAGMRILCADKTGTLTKNELELQEPVVLEAQDKQDLILAAALTARRDTEDPIDNAILAGLEKVADISLETLDEYEIEEFKPFNPTSKRAEAQVKHNRDNFWVAKGAPQVILDLVEADEQRKREVNEKVDELGEQGYRALGVARRQNGNWHYLGILPLLDPPREDVAEVVKEAQGYGVDIRMVTGDHVAIGKQVARQIGLGQDIEEAGEIFHESVDEEKEEEAVLAADGFAEVTPEHKFKIIKYLQASGYIIGMTGDGVNDAPALKQAEVGIAVAGATDAARSAADLVLTEPGLGVIVRAVEEARRIFERMISYATYRITETIRLVVFLALSVLIFNFYPVTPIMVVLLAILNDIPIMLISKDNVPVQKRPVRWDMKRVIVTACLLGGFGQVESFGLFWYIMLHLKLPVATVKTMMFLKLLVAGHMTIFLTRNMGWLWDRPFPNLYLFLGLEGTQILGSLVAFFGFLMPAIKWQYILAIWGYALAWMLILNVIKVLVFKVLGWKGGFTR
jgi:H+-transporting ATPase